jgi:tRNA(Arg) A34 adenosine deaminase TadA
MSKIFTPSWAIDALRRANEVARQAKAEGHHPFGAVLLAPDLRTVLDQQGNLDTVNHAESTLARRAFEKFDADYLWQCTLATTVEPCAMCSGTQYWANIGRLVYGLSERELLDLTGNHAQNPTMDLSSRAVLGAGQKKIEVIGPVPELQDELIDLHVGFWS